MSDYIDTEPDHAEDCTCDDCMTAWEDRARWEELNEARRPFPPSEDATK